MDDAKERFGDGCIAMIDCHQNDKDVYLGCHNDLLQSDQRIDFEKVQNWLADNVILEKLA